jgi:TDG/mug DNA glycosylase family protein
VADLKAAYGRTIPDVMTTGLAVVFCGINPGLYSAATGRHFARPGNRFWPALHRSGFTPEQLRPQDQFGLLAYKLGITNLVDRATARADELSAAELAEGGRNMERKMRQWKPRWLAVLGFGAYRTAFGDRTATVGPQDRTIGETRLWVLPNPSGLNAHYSLNRLAEEFATLRQAAQDHLP